jgi:glycerol-3-phosphate dehydrogenase
MIDMFDIAIVGGGINGCGIARDAAGRGLKVCLCERDDLGGATSSASTKLLHGGLRYLEHYEFRLVREALQERETLWAIAPHIVKPMRFILPYTQGMRSKWLLRAGLFIYDHIGGREALPGTTTVDLSTGAFAQGLKNKVQTGYEYSDCWVEDSRLVMLNARSAHERGAAIYARTACTSALAQDGVWVLTLQDSATGAFSEIRTRTLVNAAGPWANEVATDIAARPPQGRVRLVQGSHIVVKKLYPHDRCFIFQNGDGRIVFAIPYENDFTLIGTTDRDFVGDLKNIQASSDEISYLCTAASAYFEQGITPKDIVWSYSGVRPLYDDGTEAAQAATRDYTLELDTGGGAPMLSIFGGKITTYRRLAEAALGKLAPFFSEVQQQTIGERQGWTAKASLPGGDFLPVDFNGQVQQLLARYPFLADTLARRLVCYYGTQAAQLLGKARSTADLGLDFGAGLSQAEVDYMRQHEWARSADDVLWRRSKLGLRLNPQETEKLTQYMNAV